MPSGSAQENRVFSFRNGNWGSGLKRLGAAQRVSGREVDCYCPSLPSQVNQDAALAASSRLPDEPIDLENGKQNRGSDTNE